MHFAIKFLISGGIFLVASCSAPATHTPLSRNAFLKEIGVGICENSTVNYSTEYAPDLNKFWEIYIVEFTNNDCLRRFYDEVKAGSSSYVTLDNRKYYRSQGIIRKNQSQFIINRIDHLRIAFLIKKI
jgi:hypothetical protein